ncbi:hypothetical protein ACFSAA_04205 [Sphingomonas qilianensis]
MLSANFAWRSAIAACAPRLARTDDHDIVTLHHRASRAACQRT